MLALRPTDTAALARVTRWRLKEMREGHNPDDPDFLEHVVEQLEAMAS